MRMAELAKTTGVPVATLKYYARAGLLHPGTPTAVNQADYDDGHVRRVKLVRALLQLGHLTIADTQRVIAAVEDDALPMHQAFGLAQDAMAPVREHAAVDRAAVLADVDRFITRHGLRVRPSAAVRSMLADALVSLAECDMLPAGLDAPTSVLDELVAPVVARAQLEVGSLPSGASRSELMAKMVAGTVVYEAAYDALRRLALEHASAGLFDQ